MKGKQHPILRALDALLAVLSPVFCFLFPYWSRAVLKASLSTVPDDWVRAWGERDARLALLEGKLETLTAESAEVREEADRLACRVEVLVAKVEMLEAFRERDKAISKK